ncbi:MAG: hypothetical protein WDN46_02685 [Methylocella sp.]
MENCLNAWEFIDLTCEKSAIRHGGGPKVSDSSGGSAAALRMAAHLPRQSFTAN